MLKPNKPTFGFNYWISELVKAGQARKGIVYTQADIKKLRTNWQPQPLTRLVQQVLKRREQVLQTAPS